MRKYIIIAFTILFSINILGQNRAMQIRENLFNKNTKKVIVVSHRGDWRNFTENTLEGMEGAIKMGVDVVEIDIKKTKDGKLILMHDNTLDRCTTGKGKVTNWTLDSIKGLFVKNGCAIKTKQRVPTLEEVLVAAKGKVLLNLDQADIYFDDIYPLLVKTGTTKQIIMKGRMKPAVVMERFGKYLNDVMYMPIVDLDKEGAKEDIEEFINTIHPVAFELLFRKDSNNLPKQIKKSLKGRSLIWYNTLWDTMAGGHDDDMSLGDPDKGYGYLINKLGARIIQTDRPAYLIEYLKNKNMHD